MVNAMKRMQLRVAALVAVAAIVAATVGASVGSARTAHRNLRASSGLDKVTLLLGWTYGGPFAPLYLGVEKGIFAKQGIDLTIVQGKGTVPSAAAVAAGHDQFGYFDMTATSQLIDKGVPVVGIAQILQRTTMAVISLKSSHITSLKDLYGKTLVDTPGDSNSLVWPAIVAANHLDNSMIHHEGLSSSVYLKALADGQVDAVNGYEDWEGFTLENEGLKINMIPYSAHGGNVLGYGMFTSTKLAKSDPDLVTRFVTAVSESFSYAMAHVNAAVALGEKDFPTYSAALARKQVAYQKTQFGPSVAHGKPIGWMAPSTWQSTAKILKKYLGVKHINESKYFTDRFFSKLIKAT